MNTCYNLTFSSLYPSFTDNNMNKNNFLYRMLFTDVYQGYVSQLEGIYDRPFL